MSPQDGEYGPARLCAAALLGFDLDIGAETKLIESPDGLHEAGNPFPSERRPEPTAGVQASERREVVSRQRTAAIRRSLERAVVKEKGDSVRRQPNVELDPMKAEPRGHSKRRQRVLRRMASRAAVADHLREMERSPPHGMDSIDAEKDGAAVLF